MLPEHILWHGSLYFEHCTQIAIYLSLCSNNNKCAPLVGLTPQATIYDSYQFYILIGPSLLWPIPFKQILLLIYLVKIWILSILMNSFVFKWILHTLIHLAILIGFQYLKNEPCGQSGWKLITCLYMALTWVIRCWWMIITQKLTLKLIAPIATAGPFEF